MRARLAQWLRAAADRLAGQSESDALRQRIRVLEIDLGQAERKFASECAYVEKLLTEQDALQRQGASWLRTAGALSERVIRDDLDVAARRIDEGPVFGRRKHPPHLRPVD